MQKFTKLLAAVWLGLAAMTGWANENEKEAEQAVARDQQIFCLKVDKVLADLKICELSAPQGDVQGILRSLEDVESSAYYKQLTEEAAGGNLARKAPLGRFGEAKLLIRGLLEEESADTIMSAVGRARECLISVKEGSLTADQVKALEKQAQDEGLRRSYGMAATLLVGALVLFVAAFTLGDLVASSVT